MLTITHEAVQYETENEINETETILSLGLKSIYENKSQNLFFAVLHSNTKKQISMKFVTNVGLHLITALL